MDHAKEKKLSLGLGWCFPAVLFLFNPNINIIDVFPDFIGYAFLCLAFAKIGELNESVAAALSGFRKMILIDLCKIPAMVWVFGLSVPAERNSSLLLWAFVFAALEMIFAIPAYLKLFDGLTQIGYLYSNESLFGDRAESGKKSRTDRMKWMTVIFVGAKALLSVLPEFADLSNASYDETVGFVNLYRYIGVMRLLAFLPALVVGVIWLCRMAAYMVRLRKDRVLREGLLTAYRTDVLPRKGLFIRRNFGAANVLILISLILTADFRIEYVNLIPDLLAVAVLLAALLLLKRYNDTPLRRWLPAWLLYCIACGAEILFETRFFDRYTYSAIIRDFDAMTAYYIWIAATAVKAVSFLWMMFALVRYVGRTVELHTGYVSGRDTPDEREKKMITDLHRELKNGLWLSFAFAVLYAVVDVCYPIFVPDAGFMGLIHGLAALLCVVFFAKGLSAVRNGVDTKYMLS